MQTNDRVIADFLRWLRSGHTKATVVSYTDGLRSFKHWIATKDKDIHELSLNDIAEYSQYIENRGVRSATHFHYMGAFKCLWKWLYRQGKVSLEPALIPMPIVDKERRDVLMPDEFEVLMGCFDERYPMELRNKTIIAFLYVTGLRLCEFLEMTLSDMNMSERSANIRTYKRKNHRRTIYWDHRTHELLVRWLSIRDSIVAEGGVDHRSPFVSMDSNAMGLPIKRCVVQRIFRSARKRTGMTKKITPHSCRHGFATKGVRSNINITYLKELLGHANINNTMVYVHQEQKHLMEEYRKIYG